MIEGVLKHLGSVLWDALFFVLQIVNRLAKDEEFELMPWSRLRLHTLLFAWLVAQVSVTDGFAQTEMRLAGHPALSPDGLTLAVDWGGDLWVGSSHGGRMRRLTSAAARESRPVFSPDGQTLAFVSDRSGSSQVYTMPLEGGAPTQLTFHAQGSRIEDWTPDGKRLLISAERDHSWANKRRLFLISAIEPSQEQLLFDATARNGRISACGTKLLFAREGVDWWRHAYRGSDRGQVWQYDMESGKFERLTCGGAGTRWPLWLKSGDAEDESSAKQQVIIAENRSGYFNLSLRDEDGQLTSLTAYEDDSVVFPAVAREQQLIVFRKGFELFRYDLTRDERPQLIRLYCQEDLAKSDDLRRVLREATEVCFSSDGLEIAMIAGGDLWVMDTVLREPRQVTRTAVAERSPQFSPDDQSIVFVSDRAAQSDLWIARRANPELFWWQNSQFDLEQLTDSEATASNPQWSPTGTQIAYTQDHDQLWVRNLQTQEDTKIHVSTSSVDFDWSPDGNWLCYSAKDANYNSEVYIAPASGDFHPINVSQHFQDDYGPRWSPDGSMLAFTGYRENNTRDIFVVSLDGRDWRSRSRQMRIDAALQAMKRDHGKDDTKDQPSGKSATLLAAVSSETAMRDDSSDSANAGGNQPVLPTAFENVAWPEITERIEIPDSHEYRLLWSSDSKSLMYTARSQSRNDTYLLNLEDGKEHELLTRNTGSDSRWIEEEDVIVWRSGGVPGSVTKSGDTTDYDFKAYQRTSRAEFFAAVFDECWRAIRDRFYDEKLNNLDWSAVREQYGKMARESVDEYAVAEVVKMMLGKLNASHLGFSLRSLGSTDDDGWFDRTVHLGIRFRLSDDEQSLVVTEVLPGSPAANWTTGVNVGESIVSVNGLAVEDVDCPVQLFSQPSYDPLAIEVESSSGKRRRVTLTPVNSSKIETLRYKQWARENRNHVAEQSNGQLAYLHVRRMTKESQLQFERELYDAYAAGKSGLIVDVRNNRGGNIADHLLAMLSPGRHADTFRRNGDLGYPQYRKPHVTWDKPLVVLCNQNSFSNAEIFCHAIRTMGRGKLIGTPTSGGVISTFQTTIRGVGRLRIPHRGWQVYTTGQNMDQVGAEPDIRVDLTPADVVAGRDVQLDRAVLELMKQLGDSQDSPADSK